MRSRQPAWADYIDAFHAQHPGITEDVLARCTDDTGTHPYAWLTDGLDPQAQVVDLACGSGPTRHARRRDMGRRRSLAHRAPPRTRTRPRGRWFEPTSPTCRSAADTADTVAVLDGADARSTRAPPSSTRSGGSSPRPASFGSCSPRRRPLTVSDRVRTSGCSRRRVHGPVSRRRPSADTPRACSRLRGSSSLPTKRNASATGSRSRRPRPFHRVLVPAGPSSRRSGPRRRPPGSPPSSVCHCGASSLTQSREQ